MRNQGDVTVELDDDQGAPTFVIKRFQVGDVGVVFPCRHKSFKKTWDLVRDHEMHDQGPQN